MSSGRSRSKPGGIEGNGTGQLLGFADYINLLGENKKYEEKHGRFIGLW